MPYKSEKITIEGTKHDRRRKLTEEDKLDIKANVSELSQRELAKLYNVSRRSIQFILDPAKLERNKQARKERGGSKIYYNKEKQTASIREHRQYKQGLFIKGEIK